MKITQDVREYAAQKEIDEQAALGVGMKEKAKELVASGMCRCRSSRRLNGNSPVFRGSHLRSKSESGCFHIS